MKNCGEITSIGQHHSSPNHLSVTVAHGVRKKPKSGKTSPYPGEYDARPTSNIMVHKKHAKNYVVGQNVNVGMTPSDAKPEELF